MTDTSPSEQILAQTAPRHVASLAEAIYLWHAAHPDFSRFGPPALVTSDHEPVEARVHLVPSTSAASPTLQRCGGCKQWLPESAFTWTQPYRCRDCERIRKAAWRRARRAAS